MSKRIGPSMSTEPGWMAARRAAPYYLGARRQTAANDPSMLLSFERPALAGVRVETSESGVTDWRDAGRRYTPLHGP